MILGRLNDPRLGTVCDQMRRRISCSWLDQSPASDQDPAAAGLIVQLR